MSDDREFLKRSLRLLAEKVRQGQDPDAHPSVEGLVAYHAGEMSDGEALDIQRHLGICHECPELVLALDGFTDRSGGKPGISPAGIESAWEELRQRLAAEGWFQGGARSSRSWRPLSPPQRRLVAVVAVLVVACLGVFLAYSPLDRQPRIVDAPGEDALARDLDPQTRGPVQEIEVPRAAGHFFLRMAPEGPRLAEYRVELWTAGLPERRLWSDRWRPGRDSGDLVLQVPHGFLPAGEYRLRLHAPEDGKPAPEQPDVRRFLLSYR
ncbi:MAG TPA: hypothetical protein VFE33_09930 [Thermoanaerobaculia bacterium]|nr:hypothetical protein [Thermoanaerobaculia bacterium]